MGVTRAAGGTGDCRGSAVALVGAVGLRKAAAAEMLNASRDPCRSCRLHGERRRVDQVCVLDARSSLPRRNTVEFFLARPMLVFSFLSSLFLGVTKSMDALDNVFPFRFLWR